ncbi:MAG: hypothetical protein GY913_10130, partial [Proteobacteria bacterium]|nr:hypothetical protein [Pseudomonadota bacterium]
MALFDMPKRSNMVLYRLYGSFLGPDERYRRKGLATSVRQLAAWMGCSVRPAHEALTWLLDHRVLVRRSDSERRNAYCYQVVHPWFWEWGDDRPLELLTRLREVLPPDVVEGWEAPLLRFRSGESGAQVVHSDPVGVSPGANTHARASSGKGKNSESNSDGASWDPALLYITAFAQKYTLDEAARDWLDSFCEDWRLLDPPDLLDVPPHVVEGVADVLSEH